MVIYLPIQVTGSTTILEPSVPTSLTINLPAQVGSGEPFTISGVLTRNDTGAPLPGETILISRFGVAPISTTTNSNGQYSTQTSITTPGTYEYTASFGGATRAGLTLNQTSAKARLRTGALSIRTPRLLAAPFAIGLLLLKA